MALQNGRFNGKFDGKGLQDYKGLVNYELEKIEDRLELVKKILGIVEENEIEFSDELFWVEIWDTGVCKSQLNTTDVTWSDTAVASFLEQLGTYLIMAYEDELGLKSDTRTSKPKNEKRKEGKQHRLAGRMMEADWDEEGYKGNYKESKKVEVKPNDFKKYELLKDYDDYKKYLQSLKKNNSKIEEYNRKISSTPMNINKKKIDSLIGDVNLDMLDCKIHELQPIVFKNPLKDNGGCDWDELDMFDSTHVAELLKIRKGNDLQDDITCIVMDLNNIISKIDFTSVQKEILNLYRKDKSLVEIANILDVSPQRIKGGLTQIVNLIIKEFEKSYTDWYYLNICRGEYKNCISCGEVKLIDNFYKKGNRHDSKCKDCSKGK